MIGPGVKESATKVAEMMTLLGRRLTDVVESDDETVLEKTLREIATSMEQAGALLMLGMDGKYQPEVTVT